VALASEQTLPQLPQLFGSNCVTVQVLLHNAAEAGQESVSPAMVARYWTNKLASAGCVPEAQTAAEFRLTLICVPAGKVKVCAPESYSVWPTATKASSPFEPLVIRKTGGAWQVRAAAVSWSRPTRVTVIP